MSSIFSKYLKYAFIVDIIIGLILSLFLLFFKPQVQKLISSPSIDQLDNLSLTFISLCGTLVGFLITIITLLITFKKGFDNSVQTIVSEEIDYSTPPKETIFDKVVSKESQFYSSSLYKDVVRIFIIASYELAIIVLIHLLYQLHVLSLSIFASLILMIVSLFLISFAVFRSLLIFHFFLKVHLPDK